MITIIDYGLGNVLAFVNMYSRLNIPVRTAKAAAELEGATKLILPGVGAFDHAMERFSQSGMREPVEAMVRSGMPVLGICVGMQMLAKSSDEGQLPGLGWIDGTVKKFDLASLPAGTNLPHMGWNDVLPTIPDDPLMNGLEEDARFYFLHSYHFVCHDPADVLARTDYGAEFSCAVRRGRVYGVQFHPEKSHHFGSQLLSNFAKV